METFADLFAEICWSWEQKYKIIKHSDVTYSINKLYITPYRVSYKTDNWELAPGVFEKFEQFAKFMETVDG